MEISKEQLEMECNCDLKLCSLYEFDRSEGCMTSGEQCEYTKARLRIKEIEQENEYLRSHHEDIASEEFKNAIKRIEELEGVNLNNPLIIEEAIKDLPFKKRYIVLKKLDDFQAENKALRDGLENISGILTDDWDGLTPDECRKDVHDYITKLLKSDKE